MRENMGLFRGKGIHNNQWYEGAYSPYNWNISCEREDKPQIIIFSNNETDEIIDGEWVSVIPETVGEFTGLTDKNGKKIFEGDIVRYQYDGWYDLNYVIEWNSTGLFMYGKMRRSSYGDWLINIAHNKGHNFEVIGNIHDNPELIKGK